MTTFCVYDRTLIFLLMHFVINRLYYKSRKTSPDFICFVYQFQNEIKKKTEVKFINNINYLQIYFLSSLFVVVVVYADDTIVYLPSLPGEYLIRFSC